MNTLPHIALPDIAVIQKQFPDAHQETDGAITFPCPICQAEGQRSATAKMYTSGAVSCVRYATLGGDDAKAHHQAIRNELGLGPVPSPAVITETICDGKLTLEVQAEGRGKARLIARNCNSILARDTIDLNKQPDRARFVAALDGFEAAQRKEIHQTLLQLADRMDRVKAAIDEVGPEGRTTQTSFNALVDGRIFEQILQGGKASFALYDPASQSTSIVPRVEDEVGIIYEPVTDELLLKGGLQLPNGVEEYSTERSLRDEIEAYLRRHVDISDFHCKLLALYVIFTWLFDRFSELSYLRLLGEPGNGKSRAGYISALVCRRPLLLVDPTPSVLFRVVESYSPTLFIDEFNPQNTSDDANQLMPILNSGFMRGFQIGRNAKSENGNFETQLFSPYGCKIIASYKPLDSAAFESRGHQLWMQKTTRKDISLSITEQMRQEALTLSNKLLLYRLRNYHREFESGLHQAHAALLAAGLTPRAAQISGALYALMDSEADRQEFIATLKTRDESELQNKQDTFDGRTVKAIYDELFNEAPDRVEWKNGVNLAELTEGEPTPYLRVEHLATQVYDDYTGNEKKRNASFGRAASKLGLQTRKILARGEFRDKRAIVVDRQKLCHLFSSYGFRTPENFCSLLSENPSPQSPLSPIPAINLEEKTCLVTDKIGEQSPNTEVFPHLSPALHLSPKAVTTEPFDNQHITGSGDSGDSGDSFFGGTKEGFVGTTPVSSSLVALDTETERFDAARGITSRNCKMIGLALSHNGEKAIYETDAAAWNMLMPEPEQTVIFHNAKFDLGVLNRTGLPLPEKWEDTLIVAHLLDENGEHGLKPLAKQHLGIDDPLTFAEADRMRLLDPEIFDEYAKNDARYTFRLWQQFEPDLQAQELTKVYALEKQVTGVVLAMEAAGMKLDLSQMSEMSKAITDEAQRIQSEIYDSAGCHFDLNSPQKVAAILYDKLNVPSNKQTNGGQRSVDKEALEDVRGYHPAVDSLLRYREIDKLASTFLNVLPKFADSNGRIHPEFKPLGAKTGRFSCSNPNVQQIPSRSELGKKLRQMFIAEEGNRLVVADWSQMELRILAHYSQDPLLLQAYTSEHETDLHTLTAARMFGKAESQITKEERAVAKMINFGIAYGITPIGLFNRLKPSGIEVTEPQCEQFIKDYFATYPKVRKFLDDVRQTVTRRGYVKSLYGRRRRVAGNSSREIRQAQNFVIQATAADLAKAAMVKLHQTLPDGARLIAMVHDEFIVECRADQAKQVKQLMEAAMSDTPDDFTVPMLVEAKIGRTWGECKC